MFNSTTFDDIENAYPIGAYRYDTTAKPFIAGACPHCSGAGIDILHNGECPRVKAKEYYPDGTLKRVEFKD